MEIVKGIKQVCGNDRRIRERLIRMIDNARQIVEESKGRVEAIKDIRRGNLTGSKLGAEGRNTIDGKGHNE